MVCSCENRCSCEEQCNCCLKCAGVVCHEMKTCNRGLFPIYKANLVDAKDKIKFFHSFHSDNEIARTYTTTTLSTTKTSGAINKMRPENHESAKDLIVPLHTTPCNSTLNDSKSLIAENEPINPSAQKAPSVSRFGSLKQTMRKMRSRFKKSKNRKNYNYALLATKREYESSEESSVETALTKGDFSPHKRIEFLNNKSYFADNLLPPLPKAEIASLSSSQIDQNIEPTSHVKSLTLTLNAETSISLEMQHESGKIVNDNQISGNQSFLYHKGSSHFPRSCSAPLLFNESNVKITENGMVWSSSNKKEGCKLPEEGKCWMINLKNSKKFFSKQVDISYKPIFIRNFIKSRTTSNNDKSITMPLFSFFPDELSSSPLHSSARSLRSSLDKIQDADLLNNEIHLQVINSDVINEPINVSPIGLISPSRSATRDKVGTPHSFSRKPLQSSQSYQSLFSMSFLELSLNETIGLDNSDSLNQNIIDATALNFVPSDFSDNFETLDTRSSLDTTDSESISSSEFIPCSYCRFVTCTPLFSDSVIPYETLE